MSVLNVTEYRVGTNRSRSNPAAHRFVLVLDGSSASGPASRAIVYFWPSQPADTVGYVAGSLLVGLLDDEDFPFWYDIVRSEKPVRVTYLEDSADSQNRVRHLSIGTSDEGVGEGPQDPDA